MSTRHTVYWIELGKEEIPLDGCTLKEHHILTQGGDDDDSTTCLRCPRSYTEFTPDTRKWTVTCACGASYPIHRERVKTWSSIDLGFEDHLGAEMNRQMSLGRDRDPD